MSEMQTPMKRDERIISRNGDTITMVLNQEQQYPVLTIQAMVTGWLNLKTRYEIWLKEYDDKLGQAVEMMKAELLKQKEYSEKELVRPEEEVIKELLSGRLQETDKMLQFIKNIDVELVNGEKAITSEISKQKEKVQIELEDINVGLALWNTKEVMS